MVQINKKKPAIPVLFTIFGAKGDLTEENLFPHCIICLLTVTCQKYFRFIV